MFQNRLVFPALSHIHNTYIYICMAIVSGTSNRHLHWSMYCIRLSIEVHWREHFSAGRLEGPEPGIAHLAPGLKLSDLAEAVEGTPEWTRMQMHCIYIYITYIYIWT